MKISLDRKSAWHRIDPGLNIAVFGFVGYINDYEEGNNMNTHNIYI